MADVRPGNIFLPLVFLCVCGISDAQGLLPDSADIARDASAVEEVVVSFLRQGMPARFGYELSGGFAEPAEKETLLNLSQEAKSRLEEVLKDQKDKLADIEGYEGDGWEELYGQSGLWRKLSSDIEKTEWLIKRVQIFSAVAGADNNAVLRGIIDFCEKHEAGVLDNPYVILKAEAMSCLVDLSPTYIPTVRDFVASCPAKEEGLPDEAWVCLKLLGRKVAVSKEPEGLDVISCRVAAGGCRDDFEINVRVAFCGVREGRADLLEGLLQRWPGSGGVVGRAILDYLVMRPERVGQSTVFEVELACEAVLNSGVPGRYEAFCGNAVSMERFRRPIILYAAAVSVQSEDAKRAAGYLLEAARRGDGGGGRGSVPGAVEMARQASELSYQLYQKDKSVSGLACDAAGFYFRIAGVEALPKIRYRLARLLLDAGKEEEAVRMLGEIASGEDTFGRCARLDLFALELGKNPSPDDIKKMAGQLEEMLERLPKLPKGGDNEEIRLKAVRIYSNILLGSSDAADARKVLSLIGDTNIKAGGDIAVLKARACGVIGDWQSAVSVLAMVFDGHGDSGSATGAVGAVRFLMDSVPWLEQCCGQSSEPQDFIRKCVRIAESCLPGPDAKSSQEVRLFCAELEMLAPEYTGVIEGVGKLLEGVQDRDSRLYIRCRGRYLERCGQFEQACGQWARLCGLLEPADLPAGRSVWWWQAKFHYLDCLSRCRQADVGGIGHAIEVLLASFPDKPAYWAEKLEKLHENLKLQGR